MNACKIQSILRICGIIRNLKEGKLQIREVADVKLAKEPAFCNIIKLLKEAEKEIEYKQMYVERKVRNMVSELDGFNHLVHKQINYISTSDIKEGMVDISLADDETWFINLSTGDIISAETPEDKRSR